MLFGILLTIHIIISLALVGVILLQRSEGGALGMGGGPSGFMTARGAGNLLTRTTSILGILFFANSIALTMAGNQVGRENDLTDRLKGLQVDTDTLKAPAPSAAQPIDVPTPGATPAQPSLGDLVTQPAPAAPAESQPAPAQPQQ